MNPKAKKKLPAVISRNHVSALFLLKSKLTSRSGRQSTIHQVISSNPVTLLFFGTPHSWESRELVDVLTNLQQLGLAVNRCLDVIYVPLCTFQETRAEVEEDFQRFDGDWWVIPFMSQVALEARFIHEVCVIPTIVVIDQNGCVITQCGQNDLKEIGDNVLITWF